MSMELETVAEFLTGDRRAAATLPWQMLRTEDVRVLREWAGETLPYAAQRRLMRDLRQVMRTPREDEDGASLRSTVAPSMLQALRRSGPGPHLSARQAKQLLEACAEDESLEARRDGAAIALLLHAGLRRNEAVRIQRADFDDDDGRLRVAPRKGYSRSIMLDPIARAEVSRWLAVRGAWSGPLLAALSTRGEVQMRGLSPGSLNRILAKRSQRAGCPGVTPRDLRNRFLWQLQAASRERPVCRYYQDENGQPAWVLTTVAEL